MIHFLGYILSINAFFIVGLIGLFKISLHLLKQEAVSLFKANKNIIPCKGVYFEIADDTCETKLAMRFISIIFALNIVLA